jgi:hypothetical protein
MLDKKAVSRSQFIKAFQRVHLTQQPNLHLNFDILHHSLQYSHYHIYLSKKRQALIYQFIFFGFGILFLVLASILYFYTTNWSYYAMFGSSGFIKLCLYALCLILSMGAFGIAYKIRPPRKGKQPLPSHPSVW